MGSSSLLKRLFLSLCGAAKLNPVVLISFCALDRQVLSFSVQFCAQGVKKQQILNPDALATLATALTTEPWRLGLLSKC